MAKAGPEPGSETYRIAPSRVERAPIAETAPALEGSHPLAPEDHQAQVEQQIRSLHAQGKTAYAIASQTGLSPQDVRNFLNPQVPAALVQRPAQAEQSPVSSLNRALAAILRARIRHLDPHTSQDSGDIPKLREQIASMPDGPLKQGLQEALQKKVAELNS